MKRTVLLSAMLFAPTLAFAQDGALRATVDAYFNKSNYEIKVAGQSADENGDGYGVKGIVHLTDGVMATGEYQDVSYDLPGGSVDRTDYRLGAGYGGPSGAGVFAEFLSTELGDGFGVHGRVAGTMLDAIELYGQAGYVQVEDDERFAGFEFSLGGAYVFSDLLGAFLDYRLSALEGNQSQAETRFRDVRVGIRMAFGGTQEMPEPAEDVEVQPVDDGSGGDAAVEGVPVEEPAAEEPAQ